MRIRRFSNKLAVSCIVAGFISIVIFFVSNDFGITWDEPIHIRNADRYISWIRRPVLSAKDATFAADGEDVHPPLRKIIAGFTHELFTNRLNIIDNTRGYRISSLLFVFPFIALLTYVAIGQFGYLVGLLVPLMFSFLPHVLFLTPLVTMDYAICALWFIAVMAGVKGVKNNFWLGVSAICIGLTMLTKLHGFLLFVPVGGYLFWQKRYKKIIILILVACVVYIAGWPWLWTDTISHFQEYVQIQTSHGSVPEYIFGQTYAFAPWWYTPVMFLTTTPAIILILFVIGACTVDRIILLNALFPIVFFSLPGVYRYDWVRLFLPAFPFVCLIAGRGILLIQKKYRWIVIMLWLSTLYISIIRIHPYESAYYNEFVGGVKGANLIGMETEFWGNSFLGVLSWMNVNKIHPMCVTPTTHPFYYYRAMGQIEPGVVFTADKDACERLVVLMRQGVFIRDPFVGKIVQTKKPVYSVSVDDVPMVNVYDIKGVRQ